jgi:DNA-binding FadR family transcriptional regulator
MTRFARELPPPSAPNNCYTWSYLDSSFHRTLYEHAINRLLRLTLGSQKNGLSAYQIASDW